MAINQFSKPIENPIVPMPWEQIWNSQRYIGQLGQQTQQMDLGMRETNFQNLEKRKDVAYEQQMQKYESAAAGIQMSKVLLSNVKALDYRKGEVDNERQKIITQLNEAIDKYKQNPYMLNSVAATIVEGVKSSMTTGPLSSIIKEYDDAQDLIKFHKQQAAQNNHDIYSYHASIRDVNNGGTGFLKPNEKELFQTLSGIRAINGEVNPNRVKDLAKEYIYNDPEWKRYLSVRPDADKYVESLANQLATKYMGLTTTGSGRSGKTATEGLFDGSHYVVPQNFHDPRLNTNYSIPLIVPNVKDAEMADKLFTRIYSTQQIYDIEGDKTLDGQAIQQELNKAGDKAKLSLVGFYQPGTAQFHKLGENTEKFAGGFIVRFDGVKDLDGHYVMPLTDDQYRQPVPTLNGNFIIAGNVATDMADISEFDFMQNSSDRLPATSINSRVSIADGSDDRIAVTKTQMTQEGDVLLSILDSKLGRRNHFVGRSAIDAYQKYLDFYYPTTNQDPYGNPVKRNDVIEKMF